MTPLELVTLAALLSSVAACAGPAPGSPYTDVIVLDASTSSRICDAKVTIQNGAGTLRAVAPKNDPTSCHYTLALIGDPDLATAGWNPPPGPGRSRPVRHIELTVARDGYVTVSTTIVDPSEVTIPLTRAP